MRINYSLTQPLKVERTGNDLFIITIGVNNIPVGEIVVAMTDADTNGIYGARGTAYFAPSGTGAPLHQS